MNQFFSLGRAASVLSDDGTDYGGGGGGGYDYDGSGTGYGYGGYSGVDYSGGDYSGGDSGAGNSGGSVFPPDEVVINPPVLPIEPIRISASGAGSGSATGNQCASGLCPPGGVGPSKSDIRNFFSSGSEASEAANSTPSTVPVVPTTPAKKSSNTGLIVAGVCLAALLFVKNSSSSGLNGTATRHSTTRRPPARRKNSPPKRPSTHRSSLTV